MVIVCHSCGTRYKLPENALDKGARKTKCKKCSSVMLILPPDGDRDSWPDEIMTVAVEQAQEKDTRSEEPKTSERVSPDEGAQSDTDSEIPDSKGADEGQVSDDSADVEVPSDESKPVTDSDDEEVSGKTDVSGEEGVVVAPEDGVETGEEGAEKSEDAEKAEDAEEEEDPEAKAEAELEKRRRQMEADIAGRLSKAALETLDLKDLEAIADKIQEIETNVEFELGEKAALYACLNCTTVYSVYPDDKKVCSTCSTDAEVSLIPASEIMRQYGMFRKI